MPKMPSYEVPRWLKLTGAILPILGTLFAVGSWVNAKWMDDVFISEAEAAEAHTAIIKQIENLGVERKMNDIKLQLEIINVEINWLAALENRTPYHEERLALLRTQQRILMEQFQQLQ